MKNKVSMLILLLLDNFISFLSKISSHNSLPSTQMTKSHLTMPTKHIFDRRRRLSYLQSN
jgi:hypothetical protein